MKRFEAHLARQKTSAKAVAVDIRSGMGNAQLMDKYGLSARGLEDLFRKLIESNILTTAESERVHGPVRPVNREEQQGVWQPPEANY